MDHLSAHLSSLRQEISDLRDLNLLYSQQDEHSRIDRTASDIRASRLLQIKRELSELRDFPPDPKVWWDKAHKPNRTA